MARLILNISSLERGWPSISSASVTLLTWAERGWNSTSRTTGSFSAQAGSFANPNKCMTKKTEEARQVVVEIRTVGSFIEQ
jgi:hypothetical protein